MRATKYLIYFITICLLSSCIKDDFVDDQIDPTLRITTLIDTLEIGTDFILESTYLNNVGIKEEVDLIWTTSDSSIISVDQDGLIIGLSEGQATITVNYQTPLDNLMDKITITVGNATIITTQSITGIIKTTSFYVLEGSFELFQTDNGIDLIIGDDYKASNSLPGLYIYLSNNPNVISDALEIGKVTVYNGSHNYEIPDAGLNDYKYIVYFCKPFNVKVGDGEL